MPSPGTMAQATISEAKDEGSGVAASPPLSHPFGAEPVPVSGKAGIANAFTPGPWFAAPHGFVKAECNGIVVAEVRLPRSKGKEYAEDLAFCDGNARLIAAAPDMFEALDEIRKAALFAAAVADSGDREPWLMIEQRADSALAKARGEQGK